MASSSFKPSSDSMSALYPDRPVRPLPKRRLRERLPPDVADDIQYPAATRNSNPIFRLPLYTAKKTSTQSLVGGGDVYSSTSPSAEHTEPKKQAIVDRTATGNPLSNLQSKTASYVPKPEPGRLLTPLLLLSTDSSVDGQDSFETNNKKKRKIPSANDSALHNSNSLGERHGVNSPTIPVTPVFARQDSLPLSPLLASPLSGSFAIPGTQGFSGAGRGRFGASRTDRTPLKDLSSGGNNCEPRGHRSRSGAWTPHAGANSGSGIISSAIANAGKLARGQENVDFTYKHSAPSSSNASSAQYAFDFKSQAPGTVPWPGPNPGNSSGRTKAVTTQTNPDQASCLSPNTMSAQAGSPTSPVAVADDMEKQQRRSLAKGYVRAAEERRQQKQRENEIKPLKSEDIWICEFCEYERIFGKPPRALIKLYEAKEHDLRIQEGERKRLLEKAKAKSRKGKKQGKTPIKGGGQAASQDLAPDSSAEQSSLADQHIWAPPPSECTDAEIDAALSPDRESSIPPHVGTSNNGDSDFGGQQPNSIPIAV